MKKLILISTILMMVLLMGCNTTDTNENNEDLTVEMPVIITGWSFGSMNLNFTDEEYLLKIAQYKGGSVEDRAYTILVTLNRANNGEFSEKYKQYTFSAVQEVVLEELYDENGLEPYDFEGIVPDNTTRKAMKMIKYDGFDNSNESLEYK